MATAKQRRVCVVTGAGAGLGESLSRRFAAAGDIALVVDRDRDRATAVSASISADGGASAACIVDISDEDAVTALAAELHAEYGAIDVLVNNAGVALREGDVVAMSRKAWDLTLSVNLTGTFLMCRHLVPLMPMDSAIVNVATVAALHAVPGSDAYAAAKGGVVALSRAMALSLADRKIRVNVVCPGIFATAEVKERLDDPRVQAMMARTAPIGRDLGDPDEFAAVVEFLCSPAAAYVNGAEIVVDGGGIA